MPNSMTGFGRAEHLFNDRRFKAEVKSVNHRYSDFSVKLPRFLNAFEDKIRKRLARDITRGKVEVWISFESFTQRDVSVRVNPAFADAYIAALNELTERYGLPDAPSLAMLASHHDILSIEKSDLSDENLQQELWEGLSQALEQALVSYNAMRGAEGRALLADIKEKQANIYLLASQIKERVPDIKTEYAARLRERITEILQAHTLTLDEGRLLTEIAVFADRSCVDEELTRLDSHLSQLTAIISEPGAIGRKLDFLVQELNREANTIGSKSNDAALSKLVVDLKGEIEKIREQVQNIE